MAKTLQKRLTGPMDDEAIGPNAQAAWEPGRTERLQATASTDAFNQVVASHWRGRV
jgi:hypothetical protein